MYAVGVGVDSDKFVPEPGEKVNCRLEKDDEKFRLLYVGKIEERRVSAVFSGVGNRYEADNRQETWVITSSDFLYRLTSSDSCLLYTSRCV